MKQRFVRQPAVVASLSQRKFRWGQHPYGPPNLIQNYQSSSLNKMKEVCWRKLGTGTLQGEMVSCSLLWDIGGNGLDSPLCHSGGKLQSFVAGSSPVCPAINNLKQQCFSLYIGDCFIFFADCQPKWSKAGDC